MIKKNVGDGHNTLLHMFLYGVARRVKIHKQTSVDENWVIKICTALIEAYGTPKPRAVFPKTKKGRAASKMASIKVPKVYKKKEKKEEKAPEVVEDDGDEEWEDVSDDEEETPKKVKPKPVVAPTKIEREASTSLLTLKSYTNTTVFHLMVRTRLTGLIEHFLTKEPYRSEIEAQTWTVGNSTLGYNRWTPLMEACRYGATIETVKLLIEKGFEMKTLNSYDLYEVFKDKLARENKDKQEKQKEEEEKEAAIKPELKYNAYQYWKIPILSVEEIAPKKQKKKVVVEHQPQDEISLTLRTKTALHWAVNELCYAVDRSKKKIIKNSDQVIQYLLSIGADPTIRNGRKEDALLMLITKAAEVETLVKLDTLRKLVELCSSVSCGRILKHVIGCKNLELIKTVLKKMDPKSINQFDVLTAVSQSASNNNKREIVAKLNLLKEIGVDINVRNNKGRNLVHHLCCDRYLEPERIRLLLANGCDPNMQDNEGKYALYAVLYQWEKDTYDKETRKRVVITLLKAGANPNLRTKDGLTILSRSKEVQKAQTEGKSKRRGVDRYSQFVQLFQKYTLEE
jgi:ankyrin repeat protein